MTVFARSALEAAMAEHLAAVWEWIEGDRVPPHKRRRTWREVRRLASGGLAVRPARSLEPTVEAIASHWGEAVCCWRCRVAVAVERCHLVDRHHGGLDAVQNLGLLCRPCHQTMPSYLPEGASAAIGFVFGRGDCPSVPACPKSKDSLLAALFPVPGTLSLSQGEQKDAASRETSTLSHVPIRGEGWDKGPSPLPVLGHRA